MGHAQESHKTPSLAVPPTPEAITRSRKLPLTVLEYQEKVQALEGPKWKGKAATHVAERNRNQHVRGAPGKRKGIGQDWRSLPRSPTPLISKAAQSELRRRRIHFIVDLMAEDKWEPRWIPYLAQKWAGHAKVASAEVYIKQLSSVAHEIVASAFDRQEIARKIAVRHETAARHMMQVATPTSYRTMARLHEVTMKVVGIGHETPVQAPQVQTNVMVYQGSDGKPRVKARTMKALFRGREPASLPGQAVVDTAGKTLP